MGRAQDLLVSTGKRVAEIARLVGYTDPFYFSTRFRAFTGQSPRQYRRDPGAAL
jgi:AraC family transcriptional regulator of arabinose operon